MTTMTFEQVMDTWRTQDNTPLYGVNRDLLQLVLQHEQRGTRRAMRLDAATLYVVYAGFAVTLAVFFMMVYLERTFGDEPRPFWGYFLAAGGVVLAIGCGIAEVRSRRRQARRERAFGNTLRAELLRHVSLLDYALSRKGRALHGFLMIAPIGVLAMVLTVMGYVVNGLPLDTLRIVRKAIFIPAFFVMISIWDSRKVKQKLIPRRERLVKLLDELDDGGRSMG